MLSEFVQAPEQANTLISPVFSVELKSTQSQWPTAPDQFLQVHAGLFGVFIIRVDTFK